MKLIPPILVELASSRKSVNLWVMLGLFFAKDQIGLTLDWYQWMVIAYCAYAFGQGLADLGEKFGEAMSKKPTVVIYPQDPNLPPTP